jgi:predicted phosphoribosyltransferase
MVADRLELPLDVILVKKIGHPLNREYAIGAVGIDEEYLAPGENIDPDYIENEISNARIRLYEMQKKFKGGNPFAELKNKNVIIVDDGIATGKTLLATLKILKKSKPRSLIVAAPVIADSAMEKIKNEATEVVTSLITEHFTGVGAFYEHFEQVSDEEVLAYLQARDQAQ